MSEANVHAECVEPRVLLRHGCLATRAVSAATYDALQQTLVFALTDGRLMVCGGDGEQAYLASGCEVASRFLTCLASSQYLLRVSVQSEIELWSLRDANLVASCLWPGGDITAFCALDGTAYCLVGTEDGCVQALCLRGNVVSVRASLLDCGAPVAALVVQPEASDSGRVLVVCTSGAVWLLDMETKVYVLEAQTGDQLTCAAWVDSATFVTGHHSGALRCWSLPRDAADAWRAPPARPLSVELVAELVLEWPIQMLVSHKDGLVVSLENSSACLVSVVHEGTRALGIAPLLLPSGFAGWVYAGWKTRLLLAVVDSSDGTVVQVHDGRPDRAAWEAVPLGWPAATATCAQLLRDASIFLGSLYDRNELDSRCGALAAQILRPAARTLPALGTSRVLVSGHSDGCVLISNASGAALSVVSSLAVGTFPVAHIHADHHFLTASTARELSVFTLDAKLHRCGGAVLDSDVLCVAVSHAAGVVAVGCAGSGLATWCLPDISSERQLRPLPSEDIVALLFVAADHGPLLLALGCECSVAALDPATGAILSVSKPKTPAAAVALFALDQACAPMFGCGVPARASSDDSDEDHSAGSSVAETLVVCSQTALCARPIAASLRQKDVELEYAFTRAVLQAQIFVAPGGACVACLDETLTLHVIEAAMLLPVCSVSLVDITDERFLGDSAVLFAASSDGHAALFPVDSDGQRLSEVLRLELLEEFSAPEAPPEPPVFWDRSRATVAAEPGVCDDGMRGVAQPDGTPAKRNPLAGGLGGLRDTVRARATQALKQVGVPGWKQRRRLTDEDYETLFPPPAAPSPAPLACTRLEVGASTRAELFGREPVLRSADDIRRKYGRPARSVTEDSATTAGVMGQNLQKLNERGEKLANIQEKASRMESQAADFAASARKLREQQEARNMFRFF